MLLKNIKKVPSYSFSLNSEIESFVAAITREAENTFREERGLPKVGEGWIAETNLYYEIKKAFPEFKVIHHGRPKWLGRQHLDVYIEDISVALEYQGIQHDSPVPFFGGEEAFKLTLKRDLRKKKLCSKNNLKLVFVREGYSLEEVIITIKGIIS